jgi:prepilin-type N-terminal cleavage/methylation domain-containing protein
MLQHFNRILKNFWRHSLDIPNRRKPMIAKTMSRTAASKRGFTLTEIAIVLGIIGIILGAIWVAASAVYSNMRVSAGNRELLQITQAMRALYATSSTVASDADMPIPATGLGNAGDPGATYIRAGVFPADALDSGVPSTAAATVNPWNGTIAIKAENHPANSDSFSVTFDNIPPGACISMLTASSGQGRDPGMYNAAGCQAGNKCVTVNTLPLSPAAAEGQCDVGGNATASFFFTLRPTN